MLSAWFYSLISVVIISLISLIGIVTFSSKINLKKILIFLVSFSAGTLLGGAFLHLLPKAIESLGYSEKLSFWLIGGMAIFFILEKFIHWWHCHELASDEHPHHIGILNLVGDGLHNFLDGLIIAASFLVSVPLGIATSLAIIFHEIPQEISEFGILLYSGYTKGRAVLYNLLSASMAIAGTLVGLFLAGSIESLELFILPIAAGGFIYIATADLIPEIHKTTKPWNSVFQIIIFMAGVILMYLLTFLE